MRCPRCHLLASDAGQRVFYCNTGPGCNVLLFDEAGHVLVEVRSRMLLDWVGIIGGLAAIFVLIVWWWRFVA
jgi:hypothetical protein